MSDLLPAIATILAEEEQKAKPKRKKKIVQDKPLYLVPSGGLDAFQTDTFQIDAFQ